MFCLIVSIASINLIPSYFRWREVQADRFIEDARLRLYSLIAGQPIQVNDNKISLYQIVKFK